MTCPTILDCINERSSALYTAYLRDPNDAPVVIAQLSGLELTLHDPETGDIINSRDGQDVLNDNDVTVVDVTVNGETIAKVSWSIQPGDTVVVDDTKLKETRVALFKYVWNGGQHHHEYRFQVRNLAQVA